MKRKHVIATLALSMLLGVGVFAGLKGHEVREARAANGDYGVLGKIKGVTNWDSANATYKMTDNGDGTFTYSALELQVDDEFKTAGSDGNNWQGWCPRPQVGRIVSGSLFLQTPCKTSIPDSN